MGLIEKGQEKLFWSLFGKNGEGRQPFRFATVLPVRVHTIETAVSEFWNGKETAICTRVWDNGTEPLHPNRLSILTRYRGVESNPNPTQLATGNNTVNYCIIITGAQSGCCSAIGLI